MSTEYVISEGIPFRVTACACQLGNLPSDPDTVPATETTTAEDETTATQERDPKHLVSGETQTSGNIKVWFYQGWSVYPASTGGGDRLIYKVQGRPKTNTDGSFDLPSIEVRLKPASTHIDYSYTNDAVNTEGLLSPYYAFFGVVGEDNQANAEAAFGEYGQAVPVNEVNDWDDDALRKDWYVGNYVYPRLGGEESYDLGRNQTWDLRSRYPSWARVGWAGTFYWGLTFAYPVWSYFAPNNVTHTADENPFEVTTYDPHLFRLVPVQKGLYADSGTSITDHYVDYVVKNSAFKIATEIRKLYCFSFDVSTDFRRDIDKFRVIENNTEVCGTALNTYIVGFNSVANSFKATAKWRIEVKGKKCCWNYSETLAKGIKIKGTLKFKKQVLLFPNITSANTSVTTPLSTGWLGGADGSYSESYSGIWAGVSFYPGDFASGDGSFIPVEPTDAGSTSWEVEVKPDNMTGDWTSVLEFDVGDGVYGEIPSGTAVFISDFFVTEVIEPTA